MTPRRNSAGGFTLVELVASMAIMTILLGGIASAVVLATHALPDEDDPSERTAAAIAVVEQIAGDLTLADTFLLADPDAVRFTVPDRGHGDVGPETMRYAWSGTPGDTLQHRYNGCPAITLCEDVHVFSLKYIRRAKPLAHTPRVLLVVADAGHSTVRDDAVRAAMESWGFSVQMVSDETSDAGFSTAISASDVIYICETSDSNNIGTRLRDAPIGVVNEESYLCNELGFSSSSFTCWDTEVFVTDNSHEITSGFAIGDLKICRSPQILYGTDGTLAPDGQELTDFWDGSGLLVIEADCELYGGGNAAARRVKLPWGGFHGGGFDFNELSDDGLTLMQRSIVWAATPVGVGSVKITLQIGSDADSRVETQVQLLNVPEVE